MKNKARKIIFGLMLSMMFVGAPINDTSAQCPMCKMSAESNLNAGGSQGKGLNRGILYMLATPYLLIGGIAFAWYKNNKNTETEEAE